MPEVSLLDQKMDVWKPTYFSDKTISMEGVLAREDIELPCQQLFSARITLCSRINHNKAVSEVCNIALDSFSGFGRAVHFRLELLDLMTVFFKRITDILFEVVNGDEVGEERKDVFYLEQGRTFEELHGSGGIGYTLSISEIRGHAQGGRYSRL